MSPLLKALQCEPLKTPPVWLMRQAGRCLPAYRSLRSRHSIEHLFRTPELAARVTTLPLDVLDVDAAIFFSDILAIVEMFGLILSFVEGRGPSISPLIQTEDDVLRLTQTKGIGALSYLQEAIPLVKREISIPLIGLCGGPFSVATYLLAHHHEEGVRRAKEWIKTSPGTFHLLLEKLTEASIAFLQLQVASGVDVVQIFDSWANHLEGEELKAFSLSYLQKMIRSLSVPVIVFARGSSLVPQQLSGIKPSAISFDWHTSIRELRERVPSHIAVQGNLDPNVLKMPLSTIRSKTQEMLTSMQGQKGYIVNLGHGVLPDTPIDHVKCFVDTVQAF